MAFLNKTGLERLWAHIISQLGHKVEKVEGKGLSTNDFTNEEKEKLANLSTEGLASEEYVDNAVSVGVANLVNSAPETLDTLGEIATALEENADVVDALNSAIGNKVDKVEGMELMPEADGAWKHLVTDGEGNKKWNERLAWKEVERSELIPNTVVSFTSSNGMMSGDAPLDILLIKGEQYAVNWDGEEYICTCKIVEEDLLGFGNLSLIYPDLEDTGEPFVAAQLFSLVFFTKEEAETHTVNVTAIVKKIHTIPEEYLPESDVFTVNFTGSGDEYVCDKTVAEIEAAYLAGKSVEAVVSGYYVKFYLDAVSTTNDNMMNSAIFKTIPDPDGSFQGLTYDGDDKKAVVANIGSYLPTPDATHNGKFLGVVNRKYTLVDNPSVLYTEQELSEDQQSQARTNIGIDYATDEEVLAAMIEADIIPAIETENSALLSSAENTILIM